MCGSRMYWPKVPGEEHCEKGEWTCLELVLTSWAAKRAGKYKSGGEGTEEEELSVVQYGASRGKEG